MIRGNIVWDFETKIEMNCSQSFKTNINYLVILFLSRLILKSAVTYFNIKNKLLGSVEVTTNEIIDNNDLICIFI